MAAWSENVEHTDGVANLELSRLTRGWTTTQAFFSSRRAPDGATLAKSEPEDGVPFRIQAMGEYRRAKDCIVEGPSAAHGPLTRSHWGYPSPERMQEPLTPRSLQHGRKSCQLANVGGATSFPGGRLIWGHQIRTEVRKSGAAFFDRLDLPSKPSLDAGTLRPRCRRPSTKQRCEAVQPSWA